MVRRDWKPLAEIASIAVALLSLLVSLVFSNVALRVSREANELAHDANELALEAYRRPPPPDPTIIPTFGRSDEPKSIDAGEGGREFFAFLDKNPGRKIRIVASIGEGVNVESEGDQTTLTIDYDCKECDDNVLIIDGIDKVKIGFFDLPSRSGDFLDGYFANYGLVSVRMGLAHRAITPIDIVTAVS